MQTKKKIKAIVWDLDGTLIHFRIDSMKARRITLDILISNGINESYLSIKKGIMDNIEISREIFKSMGHNLKDLKDIYEKIDKEISKIEYSAALNATMIKGIEEVLIFIRNNNLTQAVYTLNKNSHAQISLERVNLLSYFEVIVGRDDVDNTKPHPEHLLEICSRLEVKPENLIVIGDTSRDIEGAINVGAHSIALYTKLAKLETLQKAHTIIKEKELPLKLIYEIEKLL